MGRILISHLAPFKPSEIGFLRDLAKAFEKRGHEAIFWSGIYDASAFAGRYLPINWRLKRLTEDYAVPLQNVEDAGALIDRVKWLARIEQLAKQDFRGDRTPLLDALASVSYQVIEGVRPDLFLSWNTLCPHTGIACDLARAKGIPSLLLERAVFPDTWFIEPGGLLGHSLLAGVPAGDLIAEDRRAAYRDMGANYLKRISFAEYNRYAQVQHSPAMDRILCDPYDSLRPRIVFLPPDDGSLGFVPAEHGDRKKTLPGFRDSLDAAVQVSKAHGGITVFKPHPSFLERNLPEELGDNLFVIDYDFRKLIEWADFVATTGSGLEFVAMAMGKPVLLNASDILAGKGIAYEALLPEQLPDAVDAACTRRDWEERCVRFQEFCGYLVADFLVSTSDAPEPCLTPEAMVNRLCETYRLGGTGTPPDYAEFYALRDGLLSDKWVNKLRQGTAISAIVSDGEQEQPWDNPGELAEGIRERRWDRVILDFDHTLYLGNSTEDFLSAARPGFVAYLLVLFSDFIVAFSGRRGWCRPERWRDYMRVCAVTLLMPWTWWWWRYTARARFERKKNRSIVDPLRESGAQDVFVVSFGMGHVIRPLLKGLPFPATLVCGEMNRRLSNLRKKGKIQALLEHRKPEELKKAVFVTDSKDDAELLTYIPDAFLIQWEPYPPKAFETVYVPMRYAVQGKYARINYFWNQIIGEDLPLLLLAYALTPFTAVTLGLLFLSLYAVYELGYWENDHVAAAREEKPTLRAEAVRFKDYPIHRSAWTWAGVSGVLGVLSFALFTQPPFASPVLAVVRAGILWTLILLVLYGLFKVFNSLNTYRRIYLFPFLHGIKNFAYAVLLPLSLPGALLLGAQVLSQSSIYLIHRHGGRTNQFNRQTYRVVYLVLFVAVAAVALPRPEALVSLRWLPIGLWLAYRIARRRYGKDLFRRLSQIFRSVYKRLFC
ncbi:MAG: hypothetical protein BWY09_00165 [Candidatus Hydrogenedentes bacterium ADurb.Bin179]|nr:MAG: hypothetical protein BWY09_00165 [Candidatus Hydrogenedentes bacterium ADurb.Bin179]